MTKKQSTQMAYSYDLRKKALDYIEKGYSKEEASQVFGVTARSIFNWIKRKEQNCLAPNKTRKREQRELLKKIKFRQMKVDGAKFTSGTLWNGFNIEIFKV